MKKLVIYYSLEGNTRFVAQNIADAIGGEILELKPKESIPQKGVMKYLLGGKKVLFKEKPALISLDKDPNEYDVIFIGTPVWASSYAPYFNTLLSSIELKNKKIGLFCCYRGSAGKTFAHLEKQLEGNHIVGKMEFKEPIKVEENKSKIREWANSIIERISVH
ncbi:flavodoxin [Lutibacter sp. B2]|nr:flavodoxin [Lutibacter sp. B2]